MTENETADPIIDREVQRNTSKRGSGVLIGRFLAVGLFVALGTFAVIQSIGGSDPSSKPTDLKTDGIGVTTPDISAPVPTTLVSAPKVIKPKIVKPKPIVTARSTFGSSVANNKPAMPKVVKPGTGTFAKTLKPATTPVVAPKKFPPQNVAKFTPPAKPPQPKPPLNRIAQLDTGSARSTFGIGGPATPASETISNRFNSLKNQAGSAANSAVNRVNRLGQGISDTTSNATSQARSAFGNAASRFNTQTKPAAPKPPFPKPAGSLQKVEAKSSLGAASRPFAADQNKSSGFRSQSLNPISSAAATQRRAPKEQPKPPANRFPAKQVRSDSGSRTRASLPTTSGGASMIQASRVSSKPGDRQYEGVQSPSLIIQKFSPQEIQVNQTADFEVKVRNVGRAAVDDVLVVDQIPEGARFVDANPSPASQTRNGQLQWKLGTMKPGEERTILLQIQPTEPGEIGSVAQIFFCSQATNRTKVTQPKLKIRHSAEPKILIGNNVIFDVTVENTGNGPAKDVIIQEEVPELLEYQDGSRELEYEVGTLLPGQSRRVKLGLRAARVGRFQNVMFASAKGGLRSKHETDVEIIAPKLTTSSSGPTRRYIKRKVSHTFTVGNKGTAAATNLRLVAQLPSGLRYVDSNNRGRYDRNSHSVVWQMRDLAAGGSGDVEIVTTPIEGGDQNIKFEAVADLNQRSETVQNLNVEHLIDVFFDIDDVVDPIEIGAETQYQIRLINQGTQAAANVQLQIDFPSGLQPKSVDGDLRNQIRGQQILFEPITSLRPGEELKVSVVATGRGAGDHRIVVNMKADGRETPVSKEETTRVYSDR